MILSFLFFGLLLGCSSEIAGSNESIHPIEKTGLSCKEVLFQRDKLFGKKIKISAYNWGVVDLFGGGCSMRLGDEESREIDQATVVVDFYTNADDKIRAMAVGGHVTIEAQVSDFESGAVHLLNPKICN